MQVGKRKRCNNIRGVVAISDQNGHLMPVRKTFEDDDVDGNLRG
jgi:hypothetical protein